MLYAASNQFNKRPVQDSTKICCAGGSLLFKLWYKEDIRVSKRDTFTSALGSSVFKPFSLKVSMAFQISTLLTGKKWNKNWFDISKTVRQRTYDWLSFAQILILMRSYRKRIGWHRNFGSSFPGASTVCDLPPPFGSRVFLRTTQKKNPNELFQKIGYINTFP